MLIRFGGCCVVVAAVVLVDVGGVLCLAMATKAGKSKRKFSGSHFAFPIVGIVEETTSCFFFG